MADRPVFDIDRILELREELRRFNRMNLRAAEVVYRGEPLTIPPAVLDAWAFTGLNNTDIVDYWSPDDDAPPGRTP